MRRPGSAVSRPHSPPKGQSRWTLVRNMADNYLDMRGVFHLPPPQIGSAMPAICRPLLVALLGIALLPVAAYARRGLRAYPAAVVIAGRPYGWPPGTPWALRVYDLRGLDPLPIGTSAYRQSYESPGTGTGVGAYRPPAESLPAAPAPMPPANSTPSPNAGGLEVVPAPPPAPTLSAPRLRGREF
jgi:hypothetical protein